VSEIKGERRLEHTAMYSGWSGEGE